MRSRIFGIMLFIICTVTSYMAFAAGDPNDCEGCKDSALFNRMSGFYISNYQDSDFDRFEFPVSPSNNQIIEGHRYYIDYYANDDIKIPSGLQIVTNYVNAARAIDGQKVYEFEDGGTQYVTLKVAKNDAEAWDMIEAASNGMYKVNLVERQMMK
ncbi:hypothetical protein JW960_27775 [candidate division KSB1 bacterium]|nr:hypothetical protein [candidate division KSB1 bacterium]